MITRNSVHFLEVLCYARWKWDPKWWEVLDSSDFTVCAPPNYFPDGSQGRKVNRRQDRLRSQQLRTDGLLQGPDQCKCKMRRASQTGQDLWVTVAPPQRGIAMLSSDFFNKAFQKLQEHYVLWHKYFMKNPNLFFNFFAIVLLHNV